VLLCAEKTSAPCKISTKHKQQSRFNFCERGKCAMHRRSMEGSRRHTNLLRKFLRHVSDERSLPPKHPLLCAAPHKPIKKTSAQCKVSTQHKQPSRFSFCERGKFAMCSQDCRAPPQAPNATMSIRDFFNPYLLRALCAVSCCALLCAVRCCALRKFLRHARLETQV